MPVLDTNVVSELLRPAPARAVLDWMKSIPSDDVVTSAITEAEMRAGAALLPTGRRRRLLESGLDRMFNALTVLVFDRPATRAFAAVMAARAKAGRPIDDLDAQIAAIARANGLPLATRNVRDFEHCGVQVINPWAAKAP